MKLYVKLLILLLTLSYSLTGASAEKFEVANSAWVFGGELSKEADEYLTSSNLEYNKKQAIFESKYVKKSTRYEMDFEKGKLTFFYPNQSLILNTKFIGSFRKKDSSWEWGWANPEVGNASILSESEVKNLGKRYNLRYLLEGAVTLPNEKFPWFLGGVALKITPNAIGVYCIEDGDMNYYLLVLQK